MLAINKSINGFHTRWVEYCKNNNIKFKEVDCYSNDLVHQLRDCKALMWHHSQNNPKDIVIAKQILFALEHTGFVVFPDFATGWHFDDKVAQKYLFERLEAPLVPSYVFYSKKEALQWVNSTSFPKVFKLRGGAGSANVKLAKSKSDAIRLVRKAFSSGFDNFDSFSGLKERWRKYKMGQGSIFDLAKGVIRLFYKPFYNRIMGKEIGYVYFQDFIPNNDFDIRIIVIDKKAFGLKRYVREGDFRASGSGSFSYSKEEFDERCITIAFDITKKINSQSAVYDFVFDENNNPLVVELSYGFAAYGYDPCPGYWDSELNWHEGKFNPQGWMVDLVLKQVEQNKVKSF